MYPFHNTEKILEFDSHCDVIPVEVPEAQLHGFIAIHRKRGSDPSFGATRLAYYASGVEALKDALRLSRLMTYKSVLAGLPYGGAKATLMLPTDGIRDRTKLLESYAAEVNKLNGAFRTGSDVGISLDDVVLMKKKSPYFVGHTVAAEYYTALGVLGGICAALEELYGSPDLRGRSFAIQGLGKTGLETLKLIYREGPANIVVADIDAEVISRVKKDFPSVAVVTSDDIYRQAVDIFSPCALRHSLNTKTITQLRCGAIVGSANNQLESEDVGQKLHDAGILYAPDYLVNAGGLISVTDEYENETADDIRIKKKVSAISATFKAIIEESKEKHIPTNVAAGHRAEFLLAS